MLVKGTQKYSITYTHIYKTVRYLACHVELDFEHWFSAAVSNGKIDRAVESFHDNFSSLVIPLPNHKHDAFVLLLPQTLQENAQVQSGTRGKLI